MSGNSEYVLVETAVLEGDLDYDGTQLRSHFVRSEAGIGSDGVIAFFGACDVSGGNLVDLEDAGRGSFIKAARMVHFIGEHFQCPLREANYRLRLFVTVIKEALEELVPGIAVARKGDDLFLGGGKLTVAIATVSRTSALFHCAVNIDPSGAPVPAAGLNDLEVDPGTLASMVLERYAAECGSVELALRKVRPV